MKNKFLLMASGAIGAVLLIVVLAAAPANYYGNPASPDQYGNTVLGAIWQASSTTVSNTLLGYGAGANVTSGTNDILIGSAGVAADNNQIRIGTIGTHTTATIAGAITGNGSGLTNLNAANLTGGPSTNAQASVGTYTLLLAGLTAWTNTNAFNVVLTYTNGVTNLTFSNSLPAKVFGMATNSGVYSQHMPPNSMVTNAAAGAVAWQE